MMQPYEMREEENTPELYDQILREIMYNPEKASAAQIEWVHTMVKKAKESADKLVIEELEDWKKRGVPYVNYRLPVLPEIGPELYIYLSKHPIKLPGVPGVREWRLRNAPKPH